MDYVIDISQQIAKSMNVCKAQGDKKQYSVLKRSLSTLIRQWCDHRPVLFISEGAKIESDKINVNLFEMQWKDQPKFDKGRKVFHLEHKYPVGDMIEDMVSNSNSIKEIFDKSEFGWVLKSEDSLLKKYDREDHDTEYSNANINLIY